MKQRVPATIYAFELEGKLVALSNTCTHLGCPVTWEGSDRKFHCPCHGSVFDQTGENIAGPAPRPLARYNVKVDAGGVYVEMA